MSTVYPPSASASFAFHLSQSGFGKSRSGGSGSNSGSQTATRAQTPNNTKRTNQHATPSMVDRTIGGGSATPPVHQTHAPKDQHLLDARERMYEENEENLRLMGLEARAHTPMFTRPQSAATPFATPAAAYTHLASHQHRPYSALAGVGAGFEEKDQSNIPTIPFIPVPPPFIFPAGSAPPVGFFHPVPPATHSTVRPQSALVHPSAAAYARASHTGSGSATARLRKSRPGSSRPPPSSSSSARVKSSRTAASTRPQSSTRMTPHQQHDRDQVDNEYMSMMYFGANHAPSSCADDIATIFPSPAAVHSSTSSHPPPLHPAAPHLKPPPMPPHVFQMIHQQFVSEQARIAEEERRLYEAQLFQRMANQPPPPPTPMPTHLTLDRGEKDATQSFDNAPQHSPPDDTVDMTPQPPAPQPDIVAIESQHQHQQSIPPRPPGVTIDGVDEHGDVMLVDPNVSSLSGSISTVSNLPNPPTPAAASAPSTSSFSHYSHRPPSAPNASVTPSGERQVDSNFTQQRPATAVSGGRNESTNQKLQSNDGRSATPQSMPTATRSIRNGAMTHQHQQPHQPPSAHLLIHPGQLPLQQLLMDHAELHVRASNAGLVSGVAPSHSASGSPSDSSRARLARLHASRRARESALSALVEQRYSQRKALESHEWSKWLQIKRDAMQLYRRQQAYQQRQAESERTKQLEEIGLKLQAQEANDIPESVLRAIREQELIERCDAELKAARDKIETSEQQHQPLQPQLSPSPSPVVSSAPPSSTNASTVGVGRHRKNASTSGVNLTHMTLSALTIDTSTPSVTPTPAITQQQQQSHQQPPPHGRTSIHTSSHHRPTMSVPTQSLTYLSKTLTHRNVPSAITNPSPHPSASSSNPSASPVVDDGLFRVGPKERLLLPPEATSQEEFNYAYGNSVHEEGYDAPPVVAHQHANEAANRRKAHSRKASRSVSASRTRRDKPNKQAGSAIALSSSSVSSTGVSPPSPPSHPPVVVDPMLEAALRVVRPVANAAAASTPIFSFQQHRVVPYAIPTTTTPGGTNAGGANDNPGSIVGPITKIIPMREQSAIRMNAGIQPGKGNNRHHAHHHQHHHQHHPHHPHAAHGATPVVHGVKSHPGSPHPHPHPHPLSPNPHDLSTPIDSPHQHPPPPPSLGSKGSAHPPAFTLAVHEFHRQKEIQQSKKSRAARDGLPITTSIPPTHTNKIYEPESTITIQHYSPTPPPSFLANRSGRPLSVGGGSSRSSPSSPNTMVGHTGLAGAGSIASPAGSHSSVSSPVPSDNDLDGEAGSESSALDTLGVPAWQLAQSGRIKAGPRLFHSDRRAMDKARADPTKVLLHNDPLSGRHFSAAGGVGMEHTTTWHDLDMPFTRATAHGVNDDAIIMAENPAAGVDRNLVDAVFKKIPASSPTQTQRRRPSTMMGTNVPPKQRKPSMIQIPDHGIAGEDDLSPSTPLRFLASPARRLKQLHIGGGGGGGTPTGGVTPTRSDSPANSNKFRGSPRAAQTNNDNM